MKSLFSCCLIVLLFTFLLSCGRNEADDPPETESVALNNLLRNAPVTWIDLKDTEPDTLIISTTKFLTENETESSSIRLDNPTRVMNFGDHLLMMQYRSPGVIILNKDGQYVHTIGENEDIEQPTAIMSDGEKLYIYDDGQKQIQVFDAEFTFLESIPFENIYYTQGSVMMNQAHIAYQHEEASGFRVSDTDRKLLTVVSKDQSDSTLAELLPRIVPAGKQPGGFNNLLFSMNQNSDLVAAYPALPYLFVYNNFEHRQTILLRSEEFNTIQNPSLNPFEPVFGEAVSVRNVLDYIYLMENGDILLFSLGLLHHFQNRSDSDNGYEHTCSYTLIRDDTGEQLRSITSIDVLPGEPGIIYATGDGMLFKLNLSDTQN